MKRQNRRAFLKKAGLTTAAVVNGSLLAQQHLEPPLAAPDDRYMGDFAAPSIDRVRAAFIGVGARGPQHLKNFGSLAGTEVVGICDLFQDLVEKWTAQAKTLGEEGQHDNVKGYFGKDDSWRKMLAETQPDVVFISTNWKNHAPMAIGAMEAGAHAFVEVPMAVTLDEMWDIIKSSEATQRHCMMMENVNYGRDELMFLNMIRQGLLGDLLHAEAAYIHELRWQMEEVERGTGSWRTYHYARRNGNLYPTHGLGPVAQYMNLGRGEDTFKSLVSFSTPGMGRNVYAKRKYADNHQWNTLDFKGGDLNTSIIKTRLGRTIMVQWDETSPRPYTRHNLIQGTLGCMAGFPTRVALDGGVSGLTENHHQWVQGEQLEELYKRYEHPLYKRLNSQAKDSGHGGMDGIMMYRIVECIQQGLPLDQNVYEGCLWSAVAPLSEASVAADGAVQTFPDFTRGHWAETKALKVVK